MLIAPQLIFVELQKTGGTHIISLLREHLGGRAIGKHSAPPPGVIDGPIPLMGSVRNPWDWYVSLWAYGCKGLGEISYRMRNPMTWLRLPEPASLSAASEVETEYIHRAGAERANTFYYADADNVAAFREWITVLLSPHFLSLVEKAYPLSPISSIAGPMTFRYFKLFVRDGDSSNLNAKCVEDLHAINRKDCFINAMLRNERLEQDLFEALEGFGSPFTQAQKAKITGAEKTNASVRPRTTADYYDDASAKAVERAEQFIIQKFGYVSPMVDPSKPKFGPLSVDMRHKIRYDQREASGREDFRKALNEVRALESGELPKEEDLDPSQAATVQRKRARLRKRAAAKAAIKQGGADTAATQTPIEKAERKRQKLLHKATMLETFAARAAEMHEPSKQSSPEINRRKSPKVSPQAR